MSIRIQIYSTAQFVDFSVKVTRKRSDSTSHDINDWMWFILRQYGLSTAHPFTTQKIRATSVPQFLHTQCHGYPQLPVHFSLLIFLIPFSFCSCGTIKLCQADACPTFYLFVSVSCVAIFLFLHITLNTPRFHGSLATPSMGCRAVFNRKACVTGAYPLADFSASI